MSLTEHAFSMAEGRVAVQHPTAPSVVRVRCRRGTSTAEPNRGQWRWPNRKLSLYPNTAAENA